MFRGIGRSRCDSPRRSADEGQLLLVTDTSSSVEAQRWLGRAGRISIKDERLFVEKRGWLATLSRGR